MSKVFHAFALPLLAVALAHIPHAAAQAAALDGKAFVADAGLKGKEAHEKGDIISFSGGKFHSSACDQYGYSKADYKATQAGDVIQWEAETTSEKDGRLVWKGTVRGGEIQGTFVRHGKGWLLNPNPEPQEHWFKGKART